jgi:hypothetical protein
LDSRGEGNFNFDVVWLLLIIALIAIFGVGTVLEATFWTLLIIAAVVALVLLAASRVLQRG